VKKTNPSKTSIICADIGGTYCRLRLNAHNKILAEQKYKNTDFADFYVALSDFSFKNQLNTKDLNFVAALAGPVIDQTCKLTNNTWQISANKLREEFGFDKVLLLNDIKAAAWGILMGNHGFVELNRGKEAGSGNAVVVGIGTGLGVAYASRREGKIVVSASEGGHMNFAPVGAEQNRLLTACFSQKYVPYEKILSGSGIETLYRFLTDNTHELDAASINQAAQKKDKNAIKTMLLFSEICANFLGNIALLFRPRMGVHLVGGVAIKSRGWLEKNIFCENFIDKGRMQHLLEDTTVKLYLDSDISLRGAVVALQDSYGENI